MAFRFGGIWLLLSCFASSACYCAEDQKGSVAECDPYCPKQEVSGEIQIVGSTTMQQLAALWADGFQRVF